MRAQATKLSMINEQSLSDAVRVGKEKNKEKKKEEEKGKENVEPRGRGKLHAVVSESDEKKIPRNK